MSLFFITLLMTCNFPSLSVFLSISSFYLHTSQARCRFIMNHQGTCFSYSIDSALLSTFANQKYNFYLFFRHHKQERTREIHSNCSTNCSMIMIQNLTPQTSLLKFYKNHMKNLVGAFHKNT